MEDLVSKIEHSIIVRCQHIAAGRAQDAVGGQTQSGGSLPSNAVISEPEPESSNHASAVPNQPAGTVIAEEQAALPPSANPPEVEGVGSRWAALGWSTATGKHPQLSAEILKGGIASVAGA